MFLCGCKLYSAQVELNMYSTSEELNMYKMYIRRSLRRTGSTHWSSKCVWLDLNQEMESVYREIVFLPSEQDRITGAL